MSLRDAQRCAPPRAETHSRRERREVSSMSGLIAMVRFTQGWLASRVKSERGATAVEYGLMVALIAAVIIGAVVVLGTNAKQSFQCTADSVAAKANKC